MELIPLRQRLADPSKPPLVVLPMTLAEPAIVEIAGFAGAEAVLIDTEHGMLNTQTVRSMFVHARSVGMAAVFRPTSFSAALCRQALDSGADGVQVPHVDNESQATAVVQACRYPPLGQREMSLGRAIHYVPSDIPQYVKQANDSLLLVVMIESVEGLANVEKIAAVPGIDVIHIGVADLSHSMGMSGNYHHPKVNDAVEHIVRVAKSHGLAAGYPSWDPPVLEQWAARGVRYFEADTPDYLLREVYAKRLLELRSVLDRDRSR